MFSIFAVFGALISVIYGSSNLVSDLLKPEGLQVNYISTFEEFELLDRKHLPLIEIVDGYNKFKAPIFSWKLQSNHKIYRDYQSYYQIELYHEVDLNINNGERELIYSSQKIQSKHPFCELKDIITHDLKNKLLSLKWKVLSFRIKWFNSISFESEWSNFGRFILTSGSSDDWNNASYIAQKTQNNSPFNERLPMFNNSFETIKGKTPKSAIINIVGLGFFRLIMNGKDVFDLQNPPLGQLPGWTNTESRVPYISMDVTTLLNTSKLNDILIILGEGYRNETAYKPLDGRSKSDNIDCVLKVNFIITYNDNSQQIIVSDSSWLTAMSATVISSIYNGETFDESLDDEEENKINWQSVILTTGPPGILYNSVQPYVSIITSTKAIDIYNSPDRNSQIVDFGVNSAGLVKINVTGLKQGDIIQMKFAEIKQHPNYGPQNGDLYYDNLRTAQQLDKFMASGRTQNATQTIYFRPKFTIHGFRYVEVWGYPRTLTVDDIIKLEIHADLKIRSNWNSSDMILNNVNKRCISGQLSNLQSVPTDCDQRDERLGWMGDAGLSSNTMAINFDIASLFSNYVILIRDEQILGKDGSVTNVVPQYRYGGRPADPNWGIAYPQIINVLNMYFNMTSMVNDYMKQGLPQYIENLQSLMPKKNGKDNIAKYPGSFGDWCPPPPNPKINNSFAGAFGYIETVRIVSSLCNVTGNKTYQQSLDTLYETLVSEFVGAFYDNSKGMYLTGLQTSYAMALEANIYSSSSMKTQLENGLIDTIINKNNKLMTTGIIGAKFMFPQLSKLNNQTLALHMIRGGQNENGQINATYPSWAYEANNTLEPATAVWELLDAPKEGPGMNSRNHHMFSSISAYLTNYVSGLIQLKYNKWKILIAHFRKTQLQFSNITMDNQQITYYWKWNDDYNLNIDLIVPVGHNIIIDFDDRLKQLSYNNECKWALREIDNYSTDWTINDIENDLLFLEKYGAQIEQFEDERHIVIGSGHYKWQIFCILNFA